NWRRNSSVPKLASTPGVCSAHAAYQNATSAQPRATASDSQRMRYRAAGNWAPKKVGIWLTTLLLAPVNRRRARDNHTERRSPCTDWPAVVLMAESWVAPDW